MLRIFVGVESEITGHAVNSSPVTSAVTDYNENAAVNSLFDFEPLQAHILQAGIFSEKANAEEWSADYAAKGIETFTWERDQQFFLIAGAATTIEQAKFTADELKIDGSIDIFVKEWSTLGGEAGLTSDETEWLIQFQDLWHDSLKELSESNTFSLEKWHELIDAKPDKTESLLPMIASIGETTGVGDSIKLLQWMYLYEQIME
nr:SPOR domain-containing protein [Oceanobacillus saliphilus]